MTTENLMDFGDADHVGDCPVCGRYRTKIEAGELRPCYEWQRVADPNAKEDDE